MDNPNLWNLCMSIPLLVLSVSATYAGEFDIFDGSKKILLYTSDMVVPGKYLDEWLRRYFGSGDTPIYTVNVLGSYSGVDTDADGNFVVSDQHTASFLRNAKAKIEEAREIFECPECPVIFIVNGGVGFKTCITDTSDIAQVERIVHEMEFMCSTLTAAGADLVFPSTYHYSFSQRRLAENEPVAVRSFNERDNGYTAIDLVTPTKATYPLSTAGNKRYPSELTWAYYAYYWMKTLLDHDELPMPDWMEEEVHLAEQRVRDARSHISLLNPQSGTYAIGDTIKIEWETDCEHINSVMLTLQFRRLDQSLSSKPDPFWEFRLIPDGVGSGGFLNWGSMECEDPTYAPWGWGKYEWVVTEEFFNDEFFKDWKGAALPFSLLVSTVKVGKTEFDESTIDWEHPENMILLYPTDQIDESMPVYPQLPSASRESVNAAAAEDQGVRLCTIGGELYRINAPDGVSLEVYDCRGSRILKKKCNSSATTLDLGASPGTYIVRVKLSDGNSTSLSIPVL